MAQPLTPATIEEVLAAVEKRSITGGGQDPNGTVWPCTTGDVLEEVATARGWDRKVIATPYGIKYASPRSRQTKYVSPASVERALDALVKDGQIAVVDGGHWAMRGVYNTRSTTTYYLSRLAQEVAAAAADAKANHRIVADAEKYAFVELAARYGKEFEEIMAERIAEVAKPDHASLWEGTHHGTPQS